MTVVRSLVARGITICATIHCPPPHTFTLFDRALILQRGRVCYFGPNGQAAISYFYEHFEKARTRLGTPHATARFPCRVVCMGFEGTAKPFSAAEPNVLIWSCPRH
jgi:ABC-type multidrug transport system ATPase subunit